ncbi:MAG TPA: GxxExxY protein [Vicinamibacterales bacterium]|nr:GxxExxY protein [Vicinamibacterales bacterium]
MTVLRVPSHLPDRTEELLRRVIGCCIEVHRALGPGLHESAYNQAVAWELLSSGIRFERERPFEVLYRDHVVALHRLDFLIEDQIVLELKAVERIDRVHIGQALTYLRVSKRRVALVINFNVAMLRHGIRRLVL